MLVWAMALAIALHNAEEAVWFPRWSRERASRFTRSVGDGPFRFAVSVLTTLAVAIALWAHLGGPGSLGHYLLASYALGHGINVIVPHLAATIRTRRYTPGLATGLLLILPASTAFLIQSFGAQAFDPRRFILVAAIFIPLMLAAIPTMFRIGRALGLR